MSALSGPTATPGPAPAVTPPPPAAERPALDDVMMAMDVVDTLRHRVLVAEEALGGEAREAALIRRLKEIYAAQGIDVPDTILRDGVKALDEKRFVYDPPTPGLSVTLAGVYVRRDKWARPVAAMLGVVAAAAVLFEVAVRAPAERRAAAVEIALAQTLPAELQTAYERAAGLAETDGARARIDAERAVGRAALQARDITGAERAVAALRDLADDLETPLDIRVVSRPGVYSGVFRIPDAAQGVRNSYLIVEAIDPKGGVHPLEVRSEEDGRTARVGMWGVRASESIFDRVARDKADDNVIQNDVVGRKPRGALDPVYTDGIGGGAILEW